MARTRTNPFLFLAGMALLCAVLWIALQAPDITLPSPHAVDRHARDADRAVNYIRELGNRSAFCRYECPDGRTRFVCPMKGANWAIAVYEAGVNVTAFICQDQAYAKSITDACHNPWRMAHP